MPSKKSDKDADNLAAEIVEQKRQYLCREQVVGETVGYFSVRRIAFTKPATR